MEISQKLLAWILDIIVLIVLVYMTFYIIIKVKAERHPTKATLEKIQKTEKNSLSQFKTISTSDRQSVEVPKVPLQSENPVLRSSISLSEKPLVATNTLTTDLPQLLEDKTNSDSQIRQALAVTLGKSWGGKNIRKETQTAISTLGELSSDRDPLVRQAAVVALGEIGTEKALPFLKKALRDFDSDVVKSASEAMEKFKRYRVSSKTTQPPLKKKIKTTQR
jgi:sensor domain CHASE-containing protein